MRDLDEGPAYRCARISRLVHLDACVPRDGESWWSAMNDYFREVCVAEFVYCSGWEVAALLLDE